MVEKDGDPFQATSRPRQEGRRWQKSAKTRARAHQRSLHGVAVAAAKTRANAYCSAEMH